MKNFIKRSIGLITAVIVGLSPMTAFASSAVITYDSTLSASYVSSTDFPFSVYNGSSSPVVCIEYNDFLVFCNDYYIPDNSDIICHVYLNAPWVGVNFSNSNDNTNYNYAMYQLRHNGNVWESYYSSSNMSGDVLYVGSDTPQIYLNTQFFTNPNYVPDFTGPLVGFPVGLEFSVADFMQWLVDNDKIAVSVDSGGASVGGKIPAYIGVSKLQSFLEFYKQFGGSNTSFVSRIWSWFSYMNIANQTNDNIVILKNTVDSLYREYINSYKHEFYSNSANQAHHRRNVNTQTTDDDLTLVTDTANDDIYTTLLREIIRGIVALQSSTVSGFRAVIDTLNNLDFSVNVANNGGEFPSFDLASLYTYDSDSFADDLQTFEANVAEVQNIPQGYIDTINQNSLMPENMLSDKNSLTVNVPCITGFTISNNGSSYSTQTGTYTLSSSEYPWLDTVVQKIKRFASIILILGYLVHLRYRIPELVRGE